MENGHGSVMMKVSGIMRDQMLLVYNWDIRINLVSEMCPEFLRSIEYFCLVYKTKLIGQVTGYSQNGSRRVVTLSDCNGPRLAECTVTPSDSCNSLVRLMCLTG